MAKRQKKQNKTKQNKSKQKYDAVLKKIYFDVGQPGSFSSKGALYRAVKGKIPRHYVTTWLRSQPSYTIHRGTRGVYRFPRRPVIVWSSNSQWQADLVSVAAHHKYNSGTKYLLTVIDCFSKFAHVRALKSKTAQNVRDAFKDIFEVSGQTPKCIQTDKGTEFRNTLVQKLFKDNNITFFTSEDDTTKASVCERFNKTLLKKIYQYLTHTKSGHYLSALQDIVSSYNNSHHRAIGDRPAAVTAQNLEDVWNKLHPYRQQDWSRKAPKFKHNDCVRILTQRKPFQKEYHGRWTNEIFYIEKIDRQARPYTYVLRDTTGVVINGRFYAPELQLIEQPDYFDIETILRQRRRRGVLQYLVRWKDYSEAFDTWIDARQVTDIRSLSIWEKKKKKGGGEMFLTLPSDASYDFYPENTVGRFKVKLPYVLQLDGDYEVGLTRFQYTNSFYNIEEEDIRFRLKTYELPDSSDLSVVNFMNDWSIASLELEPGHYTTPDIVQAINDILERRTPGALKITYDIKTNLIGIEPSEGQGSIRQFIEFTPSLRSKLGLAPVNDDKLIQPTTSSINSLGAGIWHGAGCRGQSPADLETNFHNVYVYTNIAREMITGSSMQPLLLCVPKQGDYLDRILVEPPNVQYLPLKTNRIEFVEITLATDLGKVAPFTHGKSQVTLHIRRRQILDI